MHVQNNCLKASHNATISCRQFGFRRFCLSPLWPCLLSPFRHVAVLSLNRTNSPKLPSLLPSEKKNSKNIQSSERSIDFTAIGPIRYMAQHTCGGCGPSSVRQFVYPSITNWRSGIRVVLGQNSNAANLYRYVFSLLPKPVHGRTKRHLDPFSHFYTVHPFTAPTYRSIILAR